MPLCLIILLLILVCNFQITPGERGRFNKQCVIYYIEKPDLNVDE